MLNNEVQSVIKNFIIDGKEKSILIDGPWGCGKTFQVKETLKLKKIKKYKIYYKSLFGLESIDEINTALYSVIYCHKKIRINLQKFLLNSISGVSKVFPPIAPIKNIVEGIEFQMGDTKKITQKNSIIILDDLERVSSKVKYSDLLGYINNLFSYGIRIICIAASNEIIDKNDFNIFREKIFDRCYKISEINRETYGKIFKSIPNDEFNVCIPLIKNNLRQAIKINIFYDEFEGLLNKNDIKIKDSSIPLNIVLKSIAYCILIVFDYQNIQIETKKQNLFNIYKEKFGEDIAYSIIYYFDIIQKDKFIDLFDLTISFLDFFLYKKEERILSYFKKEKNEKNLLNEQLFYLSEENKRKYYTLFCTHILEDDVSFDSILNKFTSLICYSRFEFGENVLNRISELYIGKYGYDIKNIIYNFNLFDIDISCEMNVNKYINFIEKVIKQKLVDTITKRQSSLNKSDYNELKIYLKEIEKYHNIIDFKIICVNIIENDFYLPNLSDNISHNSWEYCHEIANFSKRFGIDEDFINYCKKIYNKNRDDLTLKERVLSLIRHNISRQFKESSLNYTEDDVKLFEEIV